MGDKRGTPVEDSNVNDEFAEAFDLAVKDEDTEADLETAATGDEKPEETVSGTAGIVASEAGKDGTSLTEPGQKELSEEEEAKQVQRYKTLQGIHKHDKELWQTEKESLEEENAGLAEKLANVKPKEEKKPVEVDGFKAFVDSLTDEQKTQLKEYDEEFATVAKMEGMKRKIELDKLRNEITEWKDSVKAELTEYGTRIEPVVERVEKTEADAHFVVIKTAHKDYEQHRDDGSIVEWIQSKPNYLQTALMETYEEGEAEDVVALISDFKQETNVEQMSSEKDLVEEEKKQALKEKKEKKKQALATVTTRKGAVNLRTTDADDYESAFDEATADRRI